MPMNTAYSCNHIYIILYDIQIDIPTNIDGSFYRGDVYISFKDSILQPSSPFRHAAELKKLLQSRGGKLKDVCDFKILICFILTPNSAYLLAVPPIVLIFTDGGPDHRSTYMSVKLAMIALFLEMDLHGLIALQRIMSIVNLGLQGVGVMRQKQNNEFEKAIGWSKLIFKCFINA